jgi:transmembrane sensor
MKDFEQQYFLEILRKYRLGDATKEETRFLEAYYNVFDLNEDLIKEENEQDFLFLKSTIKNNIDSEIRRLDKKTIVKRIWPVWIKYAVAASLLLFVSAGVYLLLKVNAPDNLTAVAPSSILPGSNKAVLTLGDGKRIVVGDALKGEIARQIGVYITKTASGQIVYNLSPGNVQQGEVMQNSISTPNGGQYQVILPDGTKVLLNAASSLTYPVVFTGKERVVTLTGEAYFEVAKNKQMPFKVRSGMQTTEVLGTHFNVNAYADEREIKTTLEEGSVKVYTDEAATLISPGQQALVSRAGSGGVSKININLEKELAWKNGIFSFENEDIKTIMRQIARWYNVEVVYKGDLPKDKFFGEISRKSNLAEVFRILELNNVGFTVKGKTVEVFYK